MFLWQGAPWYTFVVWWPGMMWGVYLVAYGRLHPYLLLTELHEVYTRILEANEHRRPFPTHVL